MKRYLDHLRPLFAKGGRYEKYYPVFEMVDGFFYSSPETTHHAPHVRDGIDLKRLMVYVVVALIPCCQAEVATLLGSHPSPIEQLWRHNIHRREFGAHVTNVIRSLVLEMHGYKVRVTEFTGLEHSLKNELILATRHQKSNPLARRKLEQLVDQLGVRPGLLESVPLGAGAA